MTLMLRSEGTNMTKIRLRVVREWLSPIPHGLVYQKVSYIPMDMDF